MMSDSLFDRYREVLRAGHVAVLRGRLEDAAASYREAALLAADRALPRTALGSVQLRLGQPEQADFVRQVLDHLDGAGADGAGAA